MKIWWLSRYVQRVLKEAIGVLAQPNGEEQKRKEGKREGDRINGKERPLKKREDRS